MESVRAPHRGSRRVDGVAAQVVPPEAGRPLLGSRVLIKLDGASSGGAFFLFHATTPPGQGPPLHAHEREDETFYMLEGRYEVQLGASRVVVPPGTCLHLPRRRAHAFVNLGSSPGAFVGLATPAGLERYFDAVSALGAGADDLVQRSAVGLPYGMHFPNDPDDLAPGADGESAADFSHVSPGGGRLLPSAVGGVRSLLSATETRGACTVLEVELPPRASWPAWAAPEQRALYVLDGELEIEVEDGGTRQAGRGSTVWVRSGASLRIAADARAGAHFLLYVVPGGLEQQRPFPWS